MHRDLRTLMLLLAFAPGAIQAQHVDIMGDPDSVQHGALAYDQNCAGCHGPIGRGGAGNPFSERALDPQLLFRMIAGGARHGGDSAPPLSESLTPELRWDIVSFLISLQPAMEPD